MTTPNREETDTAATGGATEESPRSQPQGQGSGSKSTPGKVPVRTTDSVSVREIAKAENVNAAPVSVRDIADARGIGSDVDVALRELVTSQNVDSSRLSTISGSQRTWKNWLNDYSSESRPYRPDDADDVRQIVLKTARDDKKVRAVGAGHSHSKAASPEENYINLYRYSGGSPQGLAGKQSSRPRRSDLRNAKHYAPPPGNHTSWSELDIVRVGAGSMLKYLNRDVLKNAGLGLLNMGSFDEQTMAGAINTGTHGTGLDLGTLADSVLAVEMATVMESPARTDDPIVRLFRIEPTEGITDREAFEANVRDHGMALIQDDHIFHSAVVGYGAMGVATSYTMKVRDRYFLKETTKVKKWDELKGDPNKTTGPNKGLIWEKLTDPDVRHFQFLLNIPKTFGTPSTGNPSCMVRWHEIEPWKSQPSGYGYRYGTKALFSPSWPPRRTNKAGQDFARWIRQAASGSGVDPTTSNPSLPSLVNNYFRSQRNAFKAPGVKLNLATKQRDDTAWYIALRRNQDKHYATPAKPPNDPDPAMTTEVAVPVEQVEEAVETVIQTVQKVYKNAGLHYMAPLGVRFVAPSEHNLSAEYDGQWGDYSKGVAMLELPFSVGPVRGSSRRDLEAFLNGSTLLTAPQTAKFVPDRVITQQENVALSKAALQPVEEALIENHDGRPHMGKYNSLDHPRLEDLYDDLSTWETVNEQFNHFGTFDNRFTRTLGLDQ